MRFIPGAIIAKTYVKKKKSGMERLGAQSVKRPTVDFGSHRDLRVMKSIPASGSMCSMRSPFRFPLPLPLFSLSKVFFFKVGKKLIWKEKEQNRQDVLQEEK